MPDVGYYLGIAIEPIEPRQPDGWIKCYWPKAKKNKVCKHWADQVMAQPWGTEPLIPAELVQP